MRLSEAIALVFWVVVLAFLFCGLCGDRLILGASRELKSIAADTWAVTIRVTQEVLSKRPAGIAGTPHPVSKELSTRQLKIAPLEGVPIRDRLQMACAWQKGDTAQHLELAAQKHGLWPEALKVYQTEQEMGGSVYGDRATSAVSARALHARPRPDRGTGARRIGPQPTGEPLGTVRVLGDADFEYYANGAWKRVEEGEDDE